VARRRRGAPAQRDLAAVDGLAGESRRRTMRRPIPGRRARASGESQVPGRTAIWKRYRDPRRTAPQLQRQVLSDW
jgi:hypothetical protein